MPEFTGTLCLTPVINLHTADGRTEWMVVDDDNPDLTLHDDNGDTITMPSGATTDLGSVPKFAWSFGFPPDGIGVRAYVIHDLLYRTCGTCVLAGVTYRSRAAIYNRSEADDILRRGLIACGVPAWRARVVWAAVRAGGGAGWGH
jgi:hypothetical protein